MKVQGKKLFKVFLAWAICKIANLNHVSTSSYNSGYSVRTWDNILIFLQANNGRAPATASMQPNAAYGGQQSTFYPGAIPNNQPQNMNTFNMQQSMQGE